MSFEVGTLIELAGVNVGVPTVLAAVRGENVWSAISKHPVAADAVLWLSTLNLSGDGQADLSVHGGVDKAVYAYPSEHLDQWRAELGEDLGPAAFGENLSTLIRCTAGQAARRSHPADPLLAPPRDEPRSTS